MMYDKGINHSYTDGICVQISVLFPVLGNYLFYY